MYTLVCVHPIESLPMILVRGDINGLSSQDLSCEIGTTKYLYTGVALFPLCVIWVNNLIMKMNIVYIHHRNKTKRVGINREGSNVKQKEEEDIWKRILWKVIQGIWKSLRYFTYKDLFYLVLLWWLNLINNIDRHQHWSRTDNCFKLQWSSRQ